MQHVDNLYFGSSVDLIKVTWVLFQAYEKNVVNTGIFLVSTLVFIHLGFCKYNKYKFIVICLLQPDTYEFE